MLESKQLRAFRLYLTLMHKSDQCRRNGTPPAYVDPVRLAASLNRYTWWLNRADRYKYFADSLKAGVLQEDPAHA